MHASVHACRIHDGVKGGVQVTGNGTKGLLERCEIFSNRLAGVLVQLGGDPSLVRCTIRDHEGQWGNGVLVRCDARGKCSVAADNVFERNQNGDVVRS